MDQHTSLLSGTVHGAAVQAGTVHGGVHLHPEPSRPVRPRQLPAPARCFVDRTEDLRRMSADRARAAADGDPVWVVISGPPGVGKTATAVRWIRSVEADYPDGQIHVDLHGDTARTAERPQEVLSRLLREVGAGPASLDVHEAAARWRSATAGMRLAVLLDNARSAAQVEPLLMSGPDTLTVITSRWRLTELAVAGAELHQLSPLDHAHAHQLLTSRLSGLDPHAAKGLAVRGGGLPLALHVIAAHLLARPHLTPHALPAALRTDPLTPLAVAQEHPVTQALDQALSALGGEEGAFLACSFWLVDALAAIGRSKEAQRLFEKLLSLRNDLGLLAEEWDPVRQRLVGNFPQAFSHLGLVDSAIPLERAITATGAAA
ncbi:glycoside hydrolase family 15 protein [Streptomyces albus]|uniref:glycoside hydrolase family 15 protein n=1 Tax=Streptomyces albus TaxID=1888 RepID=UPI003F1CD5AD